MLKIRNVSFTYYGLIYIKKEFTIIDIFKSIINIPIIILNLFAILALPTLLSTTDGLIKQIYFPTSLFHSRICKTKNHIKLQLHTPWRSMKELRVQLLLLRRQSWWSLMWFLLMSWLGWHITWLLKSIQRRLNDMSLSIFLIFSSTTALPSSSFCTCDAMR